MFDFSQLELKFISIARIHYNRVLRMYSPGLLKNKMGKKHEAIEKYSCVF